MSAYSDRSSSYWDRYYRGGQAPQLPSQFALFVANELATGGLPPATGIIDLGCGNGRDGVFLAELGHHLAGLDASSSAVQSCRERLLRTEPHCQSRTRFKVGHAEQHCLDELATSFDGPVLIYSRFFFHAIDDAAEDQVLARIGAILRRQGGTLAAEFRTNEDEGGPRETSTHYRRYIDPTHFAQRLEANGLKTIWSATGRGMAKYRDDDAHVARMIARPW